MASAPARKRLGIGLVALGALAAAFWVERLAPRFALDFLRSGSLPLPVKEGRPTGHLEFARSPVVIVDVLRDGDASRALDEASLARVIRALGRRQAQVIGMDILFADRAPSPGMSELKSAIAESERVVIAAHYEEPKAPGEPFLEVGPCCGLAADARALGMIHVKKDFGDERLYRVQHYYDSFKTKLSLPAEMAAHALGYTARARVDVKPDELTIVGLYATARVPFDRNGFSLVPYIGPSGMIPVVQWEDVVNPAVDMSLAEKCVILGSGRIDIPDSYPTPFHGSHGGRISGSEILAQTLWALLVPDRPHPSVASPAVSATLAAACAGLAIAAGTYAGVLPALGLLALALAGVWVLALVLMNSFAVALSPLGPSLTLAVAGFGTIALRAIDLTSERKRIEGLMETYFTEELVPGTAAATQSGHELVERLLAAKDLLAPPGMVIDGHLGTGGMSVVLAAHEKATGREIALKLLSPALFRDEESRHRFRREAETAGAVVHPNVVGVVAYGHRLGYLFMPYIAYERVRGPTLRQLLTQEKKMSPGRAAAAVVQVLAGLAAAHEKGIVHRDVKPENVIVTPDGVVKVLDFGIARVAESDDGFRTRTGIVLGTPAYMAPEVVRGKLATGAADLYACGTMLYEMITGAPPFATDNVSATLVAHLEKAPAPPSSVGVDLPRALEGALMTLLEKEPQARPSSAQAAIEMLAPFTTSLLVGDAPLIEGTAGPSTAATRAVKSSQAMSGTVQVLTGQGQELPSRKVSTPVSQRIATPRRVNSTEQVAAVVDPAAPTLKEKSPARASTQMVDERKR